MASQRRYPTACGTAVQVKVTGELTFAFGDGEMSCGAAFEQFVDAATLRSRGEESSVGQSFGKCAATYQVDGPLGRLMVAEVDCVVVAMAAAPPELAIQRSYDMAFAAADQVKLTELARFDAPAAGEISDGALLLHETGVPTATLALALLLFTFGSLEADPRAGLFPARLPLVVAGVVVRPP